MAVPKIQYQPQSPSVGFNPGQMVDSTAPARENQQIALQNETAKLQQLQRDANVKIANAQSKLPLQDIANFSKTAKQLLDEQIEERKKDIEAEMTQLAFTDGVKEDPQFEENERQGEAQHNATKKVSDDYELSTGDVEGAERIRKLSGWEKYYYMKAKTQQAAKGFGSWMLANADNPEYAVNVGGQTYTLSSANDPAIRQAVAAKMASKYMTPYQGLNNSFLGKYMFPEMQKGMTSAISSTTATAQARIKQNRLDTAVTTFRSNSTPEGMMELDRTLRLSGYDNKSIRSYILGEMATIKNEAELNALLKTPYGPNGQTFEDQYNKDVAEMRVNRQTFLQRGVQAEEMAQETADREALIEAERLVQEDTAKGGFNANPERLQELANKARAVGHKKTAAYWDGMISQTAYSKTSTAIRKQYEMQIAAGVIPSDTEIRLNTALSQDDKEALLQKSVASGKAEPTAPSSKSHKDEIKSSIRQRGGFSPTQSNDPGIDAMVDKAWAQYTRDYNTALVNNGGDANAAAIDARNKFLKEFNDANGEYRLVTPEDVTADNEAVKNGLLAPDRVRKASTYANYDRFGETSVPVTPMNEIRSKTQGPQAFMSVQEALNAPDLYAGEDVQLAALSKSFSTTGVAGTIPPVYYELQQQLGGKVSIMDLVNRRLVANGLDPLPKELNDVIAPVENIFDEETYAYINYKPNPIRTDIGLINSGQDPIYRTTIPNSVASDVEFQSAVTGVAQRLGVSEADLYTIMSFETGGTFNPAELNQAGSGATGLIQFMPETAKGLGTSTEALASMSRVEQMKYVEKYLSNKGVAGKGLPDLYMAVLFPAAVGKSDDFVLFGKGAMQGYTGRAYQQNRGLDLNGDGSITKAEAAAKVLQRRISNEQVNKWRQPNAMRLELIQ